MDERDEVTVARTGMNRRDVLRRGAVGGGLVWAAPAVTGMGRAMAQLPSDATGVRLVDDTTGAINDLLP